MKIENDDELLAKIAPVISLVLTETKKIIGSGVYPELYKRLNLIKTNVETKDFSIEAKKNCDMSGPLVSLYDGAKELPLLGEALYSINEYYQGANIKTLAQDEAEMFLLLRPKP